MMSYDAILCHMAFMDCQVTIVSFFCVPMCEPALCVQHVGGACLWERIEFDNTSQPSPQIWYVCVQC